MGERIFRMIGGLAIGILSARIFAPELFGILSWASSLVALSAPFLSQGLESLITRDIIKQQSKKPQIYGVVVLMKMIGGGIIVCVIPLIAYLIRPGDWNGFYTVVILLGGQLFQVLDVFEYGFFARDDRKTPAMVRSIVLLISSMGKVYVLLVIPDIRIFAAVVALENIASYSMIFALERSTGYGRLDFHNWKTGIAAQWKDGAWSLLSAFFTMLFLRVDQIIVEYKLGPASLGIYSAAVRLAEGSYFIPIALAASVFPTLVRIKENDSDAFEAKYASLCRKSAVICSVVALLTSVLGFWIVPIVFGKEYAASSTVLAIYAWGVVPIAINGCVGKWLIIHGKIRWLAGFQAVGAITNVGLNFAVIPEYGIEGAAWVTIFSYTLSSIIIPYVVPATRSSIAIIFDTKTKYAVASESAAKSSIKGA